VVIHHDQLPTGHLLEVCRTMGFLNLAIGPTLGRMSDEAVKYQQRV
jgi:hypothetical protein